MRKSLFLSMLCLFLAALPAFAAGPECARRGLAETLNTPIDELVVTDPEVDPLYVQLGDLSVGDHVTFEIRFDGKPRFSEDLELIASEGLSWDEFGGTRVVEFLSGTSSRLATLHRLATSNEVDVAISHNGELVKVVSFFDLVSESALLSEGALLPHAVRATVSRDAAPNPTALKYTCQEICQLAQDYCYDNLCGPGASPSCYDACDDDYYDCMGDCGGCQPGTTSTTNTTYLGLFDTNYSSCRNSSQYGKAVFKRFDHRYKKVVTTTTVYSDCSQSVTTTTTYPHQYCYRFDYYNQFCNPVGSVNLYC